MQKSGRAASMMKLPGVVFLQVFESLRNGPDPALALSRMQYQK